MSDADARPELVGEWVVPLPQSAKGATYAASELHFVAPGVFLVLARDGKGRGASADADRARYK